MSDSAIHQPLHEMVKEPHRPPAIDANSTDTSTNAASDMKSDSVLSPVESQFTNSTEDCEEYTPEEIKHLEATTQKLNNDRVEKHNYKKEFQDVKEMMEKTLSGSLPFSMKLKMMESAMDKLKTKINFVNENNRTIKAKIEETNKSNQQNAKEAEGNSINKENEDCGKNSTIDGSNKDAENAEINENKKQEEADHEATLAKIAEIKKVSDGLREENEKLEEAIAEMKQQRNLLLVTIEDSRDDFDDIQFLIKEKKNALDKKVQYTEEIRKKIAFDSSHKPSARGSIHGTHRKTISDAGSFTVRNHIPSVIGEKITDISTAVINTTVFQDVSSKLTQVFGSVGRALGMTREDVNPEQILTADFMRELNNQNVQPPTRANSTTLPKATNPPAQTTKKTGTSPSKSHTRTQSSNISSSRGGK